jgi:hypothetical protein
MVAIRVKASTKISEASFGIGAGLVKQLPMSKTGELQNNICVSCPVVWNRFVTLSSDVDFSLGYLTMKTNFVYTSEYRELDLKFMYKTTHPGMKLATRLRNLVLETGLRARDSLCYMYIHM